VEQQEQEPIEEVFEDFQLGIEDPKISEATAPDQVAETSFVSDASLIFASETGSSALPATSNSHSVTDTEFGSDFDADADSNSGSAAISDIEPDANLTPRSDSEPAIVSPFESFASSDATSRSHDGNLRYTLKISGVDTADLRKELLEALTDRKFLWDAEAILKTIRNGELKIVDLNAVKAAVLVARLKSLPFQVSWEQYALQTN